MQLLKVVFTLIAVGGPSYALFRFSQDAPPWVKVLGVVMAIATLIGTIIVLPQALDALEQTTARVGGYFAPSEEELRRRAETEARQKVDQETRQRAAEEAIRRQREEEIRKAQQERQMAEEQAARVQREIEAKRRSDQERQRAIEQEAQRQKEWAAQQERQRVELERQRAELERQRREAEARNRQRPQLGSNPYIHQGGVIPCSADDQSFVNGRWVPNCR